MSKVMKEIAKVTGEGARDENETTQSYMNRLLASIRHLTDDEWGNLSPDAQEWSNSATKAENDDQPLPDFPDVRKEPESEQEDSPPPKTRSAKKGNGVVPMSTKKKKKKTAPLIKKSMGGTSTKKTNTTVLKKSKTLGAQDFLKMEVLNDINISSDDLMLKLKKKGFKVSNHTVSSMRSSFRNSVKMMQDAGYLKKRFDF